MLRPQDPPLPFPWSSQLEGELRELPVAVVAGYAGTRAMEPISQKLYEWEPVEARRREDAVPPGPPFDC